VVSNGHEHGDIKVKSLLVTLAVLTAAAGMPVFAQSFDPEAGTGNLLPSHFEADGGLRAGLAPPQNSQVSDRHYGSLAYMRAAASSHCMHRQWASRQR
jgi:hypothetical protein